MTVDEIKAFMDEQVNKFYEYLSYQELSKIILNLS